MELDSIAPQDIAQGDCGSGMACGEQAAAAASAVDATLVFALQQQAASTQAPLSERDLQVLASLDEQVGVPSQTIENKAVIGTLGEDEDLEKQFQALLG